MNEKEVSDLIHELAVEVRKQLKKNTRNKVEGRRKRK
jgi:hypothetical protein